MNHKKTVLLLTDFSYQAKGREYFREDVELSCYLRQFFNICIGHIRDVEKVIEQVDLVLIRNTGPQMSHRSELAVLRNTSDLILNNDLRGKGDINGKYHLLELFQAGYPVIPSFKNTESLQGHVNCEQYLLKPLDGADSCGVRIVKAKELYNLDCKNDLIQPLVAFEYEVSFYFVGKQFHYALYAPHPEKRWELQLYTPSKQDIDFASNFIHWNTCEYGIQRVDACRLKDGGLLLMELEDYNPFLSLNLVPEDIKNQFLEAIVKELKGQMN